MKYETLIAYTGGDRELDKNKECGVRDVGQW